MKNMKQFLGVCVLMTLFVISVRAGEILTPGIVAPPPPPPTSQNVASGADTEDGSFLDELLVESLTFIQFLTLTLR